MKTSTQQTRRQDEHEIKTTTTRGLEVKEDVQFSIRVHDVSEMIEITLAAWDPEERETVEYPVDITLDLNLVYKDKAKQVLAFLSEKEGEFNPADFVPATVAKVIMERGSLFLEAGGTEVCAYFKFGTYEDMVPIERDEAERFVIFDHGDDPADE